MFIRPRVIPVLLLDKGALVKTVKFKKPLYVGDPLNAVRIFNESEVDELIVLDISIERFSRGPDWELLSDMASECFMPLCYGGGVQKLEDAKRLYSLGIEKVSVNSALAEGTQLISEIASIYGNQAVVASVDVRKTWLGRYEVCVENGKKAITSDVLGRIQELAERGAGELLVNSIDRDGTFEGYDLELISKITAAVSIPVMVCGGAGEWIHLQSAVREARASAVCCGSYFVFQGRNRSVLIHYPPPEQVEALGR